MSANRAVQPRRGAAAIEYAIVLPVLLLLILGLVDWSWYMVNWLDVRMAAGRGVRIAAGATEAPETAAETAICTSLERLGIACADATLTMARSTDASGTVLEVTIVVPFTPPVGLVRTPTSMRAEASTSWYGGIYDTTP